MAEAKHAVIRELRRGRTLVVLTVLAMLAALFVFPGVAAASPDPTSVTVVGSLQGELGCPGDWQPDCAATHLTYDGTDDVWQGVFAVPAGNWEYKAALNDSWDEHYGANATQNGANIPLNLGAPTDVKFYYDHRTHWVTDNQTSRIATAAGSFQSELGCAGDWDPGCLRSWLQDPDGDGIYVFSTTAISAGSYEFKVAINEGWDENYGAGGVQNGENILFSVPDVCAVVTFTFDSATNDVTVETAGARPVYAVVHYNRPAGDYGDYTTGDFNDFWGLHLWGAAIDPSEVTDWPDPKPFEGEDEFGRFAWIERGGSDSQVNFIIHRGDTKDTPNDRFFDADVNPEVWVAEGDATIYTTQADAQGFVTIHYHRDDGDYGDPMSADYNDFWGLHLWGDAIDLLEVTDWPDPKPPTGVDDFGAFWEVQIVESSQPVNFIIHRGDTKDPGPDQSMVPFDDATVWVLSGDETIYGQRGEAEGFATLHYHRDDADYGDTTSADYNDFWGLHVWDGALVPTQWTDPLRPNRTDLFGLVFDVDLEAGATELAYILHRGDTKDPGPDQVLNLETWGYEVWQLSGADPARPYIRMASAVCNQPPVADAGGPYTVDEGSSVALDGSGSADPNNDIVLYEWDLDNDGEYDDATGMTTSSTVDVDGPDSHIVGLRVADSYGESDSDTATVNVLNVAPTLGPISGPLGPVAAGTNVTVTGNYTDPGVLDTHTAACDWGDGGSYPTGTATAGTASCTYQYSSPGVYTVQMTVTDNDGDSDTKTLDLQIVVYDPSGGFVTGGGWIDSPPGAYTADPTLAGKADFGFVSKYKKGALAPDGNTEFQFRTADLNFHLSNYDWLVVTGSNSAKFKGVGTVNGEGEYEFQIWAGDDTPDTFRIKIWYEDGGEVVVYDNGMNLPLGGGSIVIHTAKK